VAVFAHLTGAHSKYSLMVDALSLLLLPHQLWVPSYLHPANLPSPCLFSWRVQDDAASASRPLTVLELVAAVFAHVYACLEAEVKHVGMQMALQAQPDIAATEDKWQQQQAAAICVFTNPPVRQVKRNRALFGRAGDHEDAWVEACMRMRSKGRYVVVVTRQPVTGSQHR